MKSLFNNLSSKPHKLFFFGGILNAIVFMAMLLLSYSGMLYAKIPLLSYHAYSMIFAVFTQFFTAFLFTMFPRFLSAPEVPRSRYVPVFIILNVSSIAFAIASFFLKPIALAAMMGIFVAYMMICKTLLEVNAKSSILSRRDTNWVLLAFGMGAVSHLLFLLPLFGMEHILFRNFAVNGGVWLYLFMVVLTLSQKMIPFFTEGKVQGYKENKSRYFLEMIFCLLLVKAALTSLMWMDYSFIVDLLLFALILGELLRWRLPFFKVEPILWVLYLSMIWAPLGFLLYFIEGFSQFIMGADAAFFERAPLHAIALGYFTTILIGFGTRIIMGHAGQKPKADAFTVALFWLIQLLVIVRVVGGFSLNVDAALYIDLILASGLLWLLVFGLWSKRYIKHLFE